MELTVANMKVGERLFLGTYGVGENAHPISWLKATKDNVFLSENVLDYLIFDAKEPTCPGDSYIRAYGRSDYELSNIFQFLNSDEEYWYQASHQFDDGPRPVGYAYLNPGMYISHPGFLHGFHDYEIESISAKVDLPSLDDIMNTARRFELFNRKGIRPKATSDAVRNARGHGWDDKSYADFFTCDPDRSYSVKIITRGGYVHSTFANQACGLRPKCKVNVNTKIERTSDGKGYVLVPFQASKPRPVVCTEEELSAFLGLL